MANEPESTIQKLLGKLLEPHFDISEVQLNLLFKHLPDLCSDQSVTDDFFIFWFKSFIDTWKTTQVNISSQAVLIIVNITGILCTKEQIFLNLNFTGIVDEILCIIKGIPGIHTTPYMQLYYVRLMKNFLQHKSGLQWLIASNHWHDIFALTLKKTDKLVFKDGCNFLKELLDKSKSGNEIFCNNAIKMLVAPLLHFSRRTSPTEAPDYNEAYLDAKIRLSILENILKEMLATSCADKNFRIMDTMQETFKITEILEEISGSEQPRDMYLQVYILQSLIAYFNLAKDLKTHNDILCSNNSIQINMFEAKIYSILMKASTSIEDYSIILALLHENLKFLHDMVASVEAMKAVAAEYDYQIIAFIFIPLRKTYHSLTGNGKFKIADELREELSIRLTRKFLPVTFQAAIKMRKEMTLLEALASLNYIQNYASFFSHSVIICFAQIAVYVFGDIVEFLTKSQNPMSGDMESLVLGLLETMIYLFTEFDLTWKDGIETIYVTDNDTQFMQLPNLPPKLLTRGLQLLNVAVRKNLSPELHLLVDVLQEEDVMVIRENFIPFLSHPNWEVRNASIQVIHANAQTKKGYTRTRTAMIEFNFSERILNMITNDSENTVRISALRCFRDFVDVAGVWDNVSRVPDFYDKIMQMFYLESDGIIRSEAIGVITTIYEHHNLPEMVEKFYDVMSYAVLEDECLSVKISALGFWKHVIDKHLTDEGMIDGEFPAVTFSKKLKKIINFDDNAIKKCLDRVLVKLSETRCLAVFLFAVNSPPGNRLEQTALSLLKPFIKLMKKHYFITSPIESPNRTNSSDSSCSSPRPSVTESPRPTNSPNLFSPFPESLYEDIIDMQESLVSDSSLLDTIFKDSVLDNPETVLLNEFVKFVEHFDCYYYDKKECNDIDHLLKYILR